MSDSMKRINGDDALKAMRKVWERRGGNGKGGGLLRPEPPAEPKRTTNAVQVRLAWYIPPRHREDTFDTFRPVTQSQRDALEASRAWVDATIDGDGAALALVGGVGCGKSHLLYAAVRAVNEAGIHAAAYGWAELADVLRAAKFNNDVEEYTEAKAKRDRLYSAKAFGIDEIRPTSGSDFDGTELAQIMTRAYRNRQGVFVTSNYADDKLAAIVGLAAESRLTQLLVEGPDMRPPEAREKYLSRPALNRPDVDRVRNL